MSKNLLSRLLAGCMILSAVSFPAFAEETHVCTFDETATVAADCTTPSMTLYTCTCGAESYGVTSPALGHDFTAWSTESGYQTRTCPRCGFTENKAVKTIPDTLNLYAIGDSITFGQKVAGYTEGSYAKLLADELSLPYVNHAVSGTRVMAWRSAVTGKPDKNGVVHEHAGGTPAAKIREEIEKAGIVVFTLGTNDLFAGVKWNPPETVATLVTDLVDGIHAINPDAVVVALGGAYSEAYQHGNTYDRDGLPKGMVELNRALCEKLNDEKYKDFAYYVDITDILSDHESYTECTGEPDGLHPGAVGNRRMKNSVLSSLGNTCVGKPETLYSVTLKNGDETFLSDSFYGLYTLPEAPESEGFFEGWRDAGSGLLYAAGTQALIKEDHVFIASFRTLADASESYDLDVFLPTVNGALCGFSERSYDEAAATESARVVEKDGDGNVTKVRYAFSLKNGVEKDGVPTLSLTCDEYLVTGWQNSGISLPSPRRTFARTRYVTVPYFYAPIDAGKSSAGRNFTLIVSSGGKNYYVNSLEPIKADVWDEAIFDLTGLHENAGSNLAVNYGEMLDEEIDGFTLLWYDFDAKAGTHGSFKASAGDVFSFASIVLSTDIGIPECTVTFADGENVLSSHGAYGVIRLPDAPAKEDADFIGWSDGRSLYAANELYNVENNTVFSAQWKKFSAVTDLGNGNYTVDYRLLNGGTEGLLEDRYREGQVTVAYDSDTGTASIERSGNYKIRAYSSEIDGIKAICLTSDATGQAWNGPSLTTTNALPFPLSSSRIVKVNYYYSGGELAGQKMRMILNLGAKNYAVESSEPIESGKWAKATFDFSSVFSADGDYETLKDTAIARTRLYFYDTVMFGDYCAYSTAYSFKKDSQLFFGAYEYYGSVYSASFVSDGNIVRTVSVAAADSITLPEPPAKAGYAFKGWSDGENTYASGETYTPSGDTVFTALWVEDSGISKIGDTTYVVNYAKLFGTVDGLLEDHYRQNITKSSSVTYDEATAVATLVRADGRTKIEAVLSDFQGRRTVKLSSLAASGAWDGPSVTARCALPFPLSGARTVKVDYFYGGSSLVGQKMRMILYSGDKFYTVESNETIENWGWRTVTFDFGALLDAQGYAENDELSFSRLYFYEAPMSNGGNYAFSQSYRFNPGNEMYIADYTYIGKELPSFTVGGKAYTLGEDETEITVSDAGEVNFDFAVRREGKLFAGWYYDAAFGSPAASGDYLTAGTVLYARFLDFSESDLAVRGVQIRLDDVGLRFVSEISHTLRSDLIGLSDDNLLLSPENENFNGSTDGSHYGTRLLPTAFLSGGSIFDADSFEYEEKTYSPALVAARKTFRVDLDRDLYTAVITEIAEENFKREYTAAPYIVYTDASGIRRRAEGEEYSMSLYGLAEYAVNEEPDTLTEEEKRFLTESILEKAR